jgi:hypothetical protein
VEDEKVGMVYDRTEFPERPASAGVQGKESEVSSLSSEDVEAGPVYDKTDFLGSGLVQVDREPSEIYPQMPTSYDVVAEKEVPRHIFQKISDSVEKGNFGKTLNHFEQFVEMYPENLESETLEEIRGLFKEGRSVKPEERKNFLGKVKDFVNTLELHKKEEK